MRTTVFLRRFFSFAICLALVLSLLPIHLASATSPDIVISQVYGGGGNTGAQYKNDYVELYNRGETVVSLNGWSIQYASATGTGLFGSSSTQLTELPNVTLQPGQYYLVAEAAGTSCSGLPCGADLPTPDLVDATPINMSGTGAKVALVTIATGLGCNGGSTPCTPEQLALIKDLIGWGTANFYEGTGPGPTTSNSTADFRNNAGCTDSDDNSADFTAAAPAPRNTASAFHYCSGPTNPTGIGAAVPSALFPGETTLLTVAVTPGANPPSTGITVNGDLSEIGGANPQVFFDDGTNGDTTAGDNIFSFSITVDAATVPGVKTLPVTVADAEGRTSDTSITLNVLVILPIGTVNGPVLDTDNGTTHTSPYVGQSVVIQGVIYEKTLQATSGSNTYKGFFIQNTAATADTDPNTSDGLFVYMNTSSTLNGPSGPYTPLVGDEIILLGKVSEYFNMTELVSPLQVLSIVRSGVDLSAELPPVVANPLVSLADANRYWERLQGMRLQIPTNSIVLGGRNVFSPADAEIWVARPDSDIALRPDPYTRRAFRDAHPLDDNYDATNWDGNGYRILMGSLGIKATLNDANALIDPAVTFDSLTNAPIGGLNYTFSKYRIEISDQPSFSLGVDPAANNPPMEISDRSTQYSIVDYNLENLYDYRDNPFSNCDFNNPSNPKCTATYPWIGDIKPAYNYVPASDADYQARLNDIALQIINDLHGPDILMVQEVENQDFCSVSDGALTCGTSDNADGRPDVLQDLALKITSLGGPNYDSAFDRDSSDLRGILPAFLYRTDRVELLSPVDDPVLGANPVIDGYTGVPYDADVSNPKTMNAVLPSGVTACETNWVFPRAPGVALFRIYSDTVGSGNFGDVYLINNHFKSGPDTCVTHRTEQARYNAALVAYIQASVPGARIVVGGDLNVYPRPDDPFAPIGQAGSSDQLGSLYDTNLELTNLWDVLLGVAPESAYSYVYIGMAQTLDQMFANENLMADLQQFRIAHINSDFPADYPGDVARGTSDHDPNVAILDINLAPTVDAGGPYSVVEGSSVTVSATGSDPENGSLTYAWDLDNNGSFETSGQSAVFDASLLTAPATYTVKVQVTDNGGLTAEASATVNVIFNWSGFFKPINNPPSLNPALAGSAIPIKFSLSGYQGMNVFQTGYPTATPINCTTLAPTGAPVQVIITNAYYNPTLDQYVFVWKTIAAWKGTCQQLNVVLIDGTSHMANFKFK